jgi:flagellar hook protein FlgE
MDPISTASSGLLMASQRFDAAGANVISAANSGGAGDLASAVADQAVAGQSVQANASVLKTADKMFKSLLDITV